MGYRPHIWTFADAPEVANRKGRVRGTNGKQPVLPALTATQRGFAAQRATALRAQGWFPGYCQLAAERGA